MEGGPGGWELVRELFKQRIPLKMGPMVYVKSKSALSTSAPEFDPDKAAVIIVDMTNDAINPQGVHYAVVGGPVDREELIASNRTLVAAARETGVPVIFTRTTRKPGEGYLKHFVPLTGSRARTYGVREKSLIEGTWGDEIIEELKPLPAENVISKKRRNAFLYTPLDLILRSMEKIDLVITGVGTPGCVESTVRSAFDLDYYVVIPRECTSSNSRENREMALTHMGNHCAIISTVDKVVEALRQNKPVPFSDMRRPSADHLSAEAQ